MGREPSPSSHTGVVTRGNCLPATPWVKVMHTCWLHSGWKTNLLLLISKITIFVFRYEAGLLLLICKITLNGPSPCLPSPSQAYRGYPIFLDTASSGPHYKSPPSLYPITVIHIGGTDSTYLTRTWGHHHFVRGQPKGRKKWFLFHVLWLRKQEYAQFILRKILLHLIGIVGRLSFSYLEN